MRTLLWSQQDGVGRCTFNRPDVRNALSRDMVDELHALLDSAQADPTLAVVVFTGAGPSFVSGADIAELRERRRADALAQINTGLCRHLERFALPTIAAINGHALGGGLELALACDMRVCAKSAKLGQPEVGLGIIPGAGATYRLQRIIGTGRARELIFSGRVIDADEALRIGLVNRVADDAVAEAEALARSIAAQGRLAVRMAKMAAVAVAEMSTDAAMAFEATAQAVLFEDEDKMRRMGEFLARRNASKP